MFPFSLLISHFSLPGRAMSTLILITLTGLALAAMYFLLAAGLSLIFGLMDVLNFAHGAFFTWGAYAAWWTIGRLSPPGTSTTGAFLLALLAAALAGGALAAATEVVLLRPLYRRPSYQVLVTLGVGPALSELTGGLSKHDPPPLQQLRWLGAASQLHGAPLA